MANTAEGARIEFAQAKLVETMAEARRTYLARLAKLEAETLRLQNPRWSRHQIDRAVDDFVAAVARPVPSPDEA